MILLEIDYKTVSLLLFLMGLLLMCLADLCWSKSKRFNPFIPASRRKHWKWLGNTFFICFILWMLFFVYYLISR